MAFRGLVVVLLTQVTTDSASGSRKGGSMRMDSVAPTMRVVMLERPFAEDEWWYVWRGIFGWKNDSCPRWNREDFKTSLHPSLRAPIVKY